MNFASLKESARVGADSLRTNPTRTTLSTTGVIIGVAALVAAFSITDGVDLWARALIARESSVQDVSITPRTSTVVAGRTVPITGYPVLTAVVERTREIGTRKAVGARRADIQTQFLVESVTVTGAGSVIGFVVGIIIAQAGTAVCRLWAHASIYPVMHLYTGLLGAGSAITVGLVFGT
ncbi:MAG: ABC transporter permease [Gemmatimonadota bacterium]|nr:ABC transporter permease [Gemmatimonadota bacterium]